MSVGSAEPILRAEGIRRSFGHGAVLDGVSLALRPRTLTLLTGRNGSGKSTFLNCLTGFDRTYAGDVFLGGLSLRHASADTRARMGMVRTFQYPHLFASLPVRHHLALSQGARANALASYLNFSWKSQTTTGDVRDLELGRLLERRGSELSFGEMKVVNVARAFATGAQVFLLDEPLASLHGRRRETMLRAILNRRDSGCALLVIEHETAELTKCADVALDLSEGRLHERRA
jgi:branched-chain amino acid transport system ATP-binding protein